MSTSNSLSSAKRRRANVAENQVQQNSNVVATSAVDETKRLMSVQDVLYILNTKIEHLASKISNSNGGNELRADSSELMNQVTDSIDNMNTTLESFSEVLSEYNERLQQIEENMKNTSVQDKIQQLEQRINEKILSKSVPEKFDLLNSRKKAVSTKDKLADMVPNKKGATVDDKFAEKTAQKGKANLKQFEEAAAAVDTENINISFSGLKEKIETNKGE